MPSGLALVPRHNDGMMSHTPQKFRFPLLATAAENGELDASSRSEDHGR